MRAGGRVWLVVDLADGGTETFRIFGAGAAAHAVEAALRPATSS